MSKIVMKEWCEQWSSRSGKSKRDAWEMLERRKKLKLKVRKTSPFDHRVSLIKYSSWKWLLSALLSSNEKTCKMSLEQFTCISDMIVTWIVLTTNDWLSWMSKTRGEDFDPGVSSIHLRDRRVVLLLTIHSIDLILADSGSKLILMLEFENE